MLLGNPWIPKSFPKFKKEHFFFFFSEIKSYMFIIMFKKRKRYL